METYRIITYWTAENGFPNSTEFDMDFAEERSMQHYVERIAVVGIWDQDAVGRTVLIPAHRISSIVVEVVDV